MPANTGRGRFRLGLAGRVALIGCGAAIVATLAQWVITPVLARRSFDSARMVYVSAAAQQMALISARPLEQYDRTRLEQITQMMAGPLPGGQAAILDESGVILGSTAGAAPILGTLKPDLLSHPDRGVMVHKGDLIAVVPVARDNRKLGTVVLSMHPKTLVAAWLGVIWRNALVLTLALAVIAPFLLPLARRALSPVSALEKRIRSRSAADKTRLADAVDDSLLKPLLSAIDEVHERSETATRRAMRLAFADPVTRLPNRLRFVSWLEGLVDRKKGASVFLILVDIDGFRKINAALGPRDADKVLVQVGERLKGCTAQIAGGNFFLGRLGSDQFGVIAAADQAVVKAFMAMADRAISEPMSIEGQIQRVNASFGAACAPGDAKSATELLKQAELALKEAKRAQNGRRVFFDSRLLDKAREQSRMEADLRAGLERGEFVAVFQPKVMLETGELVGAEALARWRRPDGSVVSPGVFVPMAEELGLISKLGNCVMRDACFAAAGWNRSGLSKRIAVNVSPHQFNDPDFISSVQLALDESGLDPQLLELEITESAAVEDPEKVARTMWPLRNRGVRLAIDDFGTGHSNFTSITRLPFDVFKIDQQFIRALSVDPHAPAIVEMILAMAEALGLETVAEGVETKEQADFLLRRACTIGQGYFYSPPLPAEEFDAFVRSWRPRPASKFAA
ncbi:MAG: EAL domain-containing protein [Alphaproteobacteria bacterium]|nr:EAL domain-containing protein [Alphaproteobacteria bacterium]